MISPEAWSAIIGLFMPFVVEYIKKLTTANRLMSYTISLVVSLLVGVVTTYLSGKLLLNEEGLWESAAAALAASQSVYIFWFRDSTIAKRIAA